MPLTWFTPERLEKLAGLGIVDRFQVRPAMNPELLTRILDRLESLEDPLLCWGVVDGGFSTDELREVVDEELANSHEWDLSVGRRHRGDDLARAAGARLQRLARPLANPQRRDDPLGGPTPAVLPRTRPGSPAPT